MEHLYTKSSKEEQLNKLNPKKETLQFLLNYSKALRITKYKQLSFDTILN
ncbi:hypothetical protein JM83_2856 [Gillisia sp. Hel_I_86]|nr:hypothetical protein [Gillisia sp. Hel_I_86]TVZ27794.1 hypothetical protein JM83_2856 [Gillisia sp. Hel_I_86]